MLPPPPVKTMRPESSEVSLWNAIHPVLAFCPWRETFSSKKTHPVLLLSLQMALVLRQIFGQSHPYWLRLTFYKGWLLKLGGGVQYANVWSLGKYSNSSCRYHILFDKSFFRVSQRRDRERNLVNVQGWIFKLKKLDSLYSSPDSSVPASRGSVAASPPGGSVLLHRLRWLEEAREGSFLSWWRSQWLLSQEVRQVQSFLFIYSLGCSTSFVKPVFEKFPSS